MAKYKVGDKVRILRDQCYRGAPNGMYKAGEIHTVGGFDKYGDPWFEGDKYLTGWINYNNWFEKVEG